MKAAEARRRIDARNKAKLAEEILRQTALKEEVAPYVKDDLPPLLTSLYNEIEEAVEKGARWCGFNSAPLINRDVDWSRFYWQEINRGLLEALESDGYRVGVTWHNNSQPRSQSLSDPHEPLEPKKTWLQIRLDW